MNTSQVFASGGAIIWFVLFTKTKSLAQPLRMTLVAKGIGDFLAIQENIALTFGRDSRAAVVAVHSLFNAP